jgi:hypothetical protein
MVTAKPVPTAIWPVPTPAYTDGDVPTVAIGIECADNIFSCVVAVGTLSASRSDA